MLEKHCVFLNYYFRLFSHNKTLLTFMFIAHNFIAFCLISSHIIAINAIVCNVLNHSSVLSVYLFFTDIPLSNHVSKIAKNNISYVQSGVEKMFFYHSKPYCGIKSHGLRYCFTWTCLLSYTHCPIVLHGLVHCRTRLALLFYMDMSIVAHALPYCFT